MAEEKILIVDDEPNILSSIRRQLKGVYDLTTADSGKEALEIISKNKKFIVIISDYMMPQMNGAEFLAKARELSPDSVRVMLTGQADMEAVINVVNEGNIFRFLTKPCPPEVLQKNINDAIDQYRLKYVERDLLTRTLSGSVQVITDMLVLIKPQSFNRSLRIKELIHKLLLQLPSENAWQIEIAAMLSQIGCVTVPDSILEKVYGNAELEPEDSIMFKLHTKTSSDLIAKIPRLEKVAEIIAYQEKNYDGTGFPAAPLAGETIPLGARMLKIALDYDTLAQMDLDADGIMETMKARQGMYDSKILAVLDRVIHNKDEKRKYVLQKKTISELNDDMYLAENVVSASGIIIGEKKQRITKMLITVLGNYARNREIKETISVLTYID